MCAMPTCRMASREEGRTGKISEGGTDEREGEREREHAKARTAKSVRRELDRRVSTWWTAGPGSQGSSSGSGRTANVILSSLQTQQPKLYSDLTFQKQRAVPTFSPLCTTHHLLSLSAPFHLLSFISLSYSCHISSAPNLFLPITLPLYFSLLPSLCVLSSW